jgi:hypothetical protein
LLKNYIYYFDYDYAYFFVGVYLEMSFDNSCFHVTAVMHPNTYLNKILVGSKQGSLQLWNIKQDKMLYVFEGWNSQVTCLQQVIFIFYTVRA